MFSRNAPTTPPPPPGATASELDNRAKELEAQAARILAQASDLRQVSRFMRGER